MKRMITTALVLVLAFGLGTAEAKNKKNRKEPPKGARTEKTEDMKQPRLLGDQHDLAFISGVLNRDGFNGWMLGELSLIMKKDTTIYSMDGEDGFLQDGATAMVMGSRKGDTIVVWAVRMVGPDIPANEEGYGNVMEPGDNPNVGVYKTIVD